MSVEADTKAMLATQEQMAKMLAEIRDLTIEMHQTLQDIKRGISDISGQIELHAD